MFRPLPVFAALALLLLSGLAHGLVSSRWQSAGDLDAAAARVAQVPRRIGAWQARDLDADPKLFALARAQAYWVRHYEDPAAGGGVTVILMCGRAGPLAVHTPDVCYGAAGYEMVAPAETVEVAGPPGGAPARLWTACFRKEPPARGKALRLFWTWGADGDWQAPRNPRLAFAGRTTLYKVYVIHELPSEDAPLAGDPALGFVGRFLPALDRTLWPAEG